MLTALLCLSLAGAPPASPPNWEIYTSLGVLHRPASDEVGGGAMLGVNRRFASWFRVDVSVGSSLFGPTLSVATPIRIGVRFEWPGEQRFKPFVTIAFAHEHEMPWSTVQHHSVAAVLGLSEHGVMHRSGAEAGLGLSYDIPKQGAAPFGGRLALRSTAVWLAGSGSPLLISVSASVGACF